MASWSLNWIRSLDRLSLKQMNMLTGNPLRLSSTQTTVKISMIKNVAPIALNASGRGLLETQIVGSQTTLLAAVKPRKPLSGVQVAKISQMDSAAQIVPSVVWLASLTILIQRRHADAKPGEIHD